MSETIYKSVYSNVPVLEIVIKSIPVMRRRKDDWMNATQILKVAGFDKPQRTRILEREVQKGEHEKVQGGYGKYQGTWIPFERGLELSKQYDVASIMAPILTYQPGSGTPPPAPKHTTAASRALKPLVPRVPRKPKPSPRRKAVVPSRIIPTTRIQSSDISDASLEDFKTERSVSPGRTDHSAGSETEDGGQAVFSDQYIPGQLQMSAYSEKLLEFFTDPRKFSMPEFLREPPPDFDANATIDDEGHSALHWASAMGLLDVVAYLKRAGADISCGNHESQTPFMRVVAFCNNYDLKTFPEIVQQLKDSAHIADSEGRTVFHHIALSTSQISKSKVIAARYYAEQLTHLLSQAMKAADFSALINHRDRHGDTALTVAARNGARKVWKILLEYNANPHIINRDGRSAQEYMDAHEASRQTLLPSSSPMNPANLDRASSLSTAYLTRQHKSEVAIRATHKVVPQMHEALLALADAYDAEFLEKEEDVRQAQRSLAEMHREMQIHRTALAENKPEDVAKRIKEAETQEEASRQELLRVVERSQAVALKDFVDAQEVQISKMDVKDLPDVAALAKKLGEIQTLRRTRVNEIVDIMRSSNLGPRMNDYRKLISLACDIPIDEIDEKIGGIEEVLSNNAAEGKLEPSSLDIEMPDMEVV